MISLETLATQNSPATGISWGFLSDLSENWISDIATTIIKTRQNISPKRLISPGPGVDQIQILMEAAASAPDHGLLQPWRFILIPEHKRVELAEIFAISLVERDPCATLVQIEAAREKAYRAPILILAVAKLDEENDNIPAIERLVSVGASIQNILLMAHSMGFGAGLTSGQAMHTARIANYFKLDSTEKAACFINIGTVNKSKPPKPRPLSSTFFSTI
jgi:nitroreductase